jgi:hypothetical protein
MLPKLEQTPGAARGRGLTSARSLPTPPVGRRSRRGVLVARGVPRGAGRGEGNGSVQLRVIRGSVTCNSPGVVWVLSCHLRTPLMGQPFVGG